MREMYENLNYMFSPTDWKNGAPPPLNTQNLNDISNALSDFVSVRYVDHENLFDNPYFLNPINQVNYGKTEIAVPNGQEVRVIDRWFGKAEVFDGNGNPLVGGNGEVNLREIGIEMDEVYGHEPTSISPRKRNIYLKQKIIPEKVKSMIGKEMTCSMIFDISAQSAGDAFVNISVMSNNGYINTTPIKTYPFVSNGKNGVFNWTVFGVSFVVPENISSLEFIISFSDTISVGAHSTCTIPYVKLEFGSVSTIVSDNPTDSLDGTFPWIRDVPRDRTIELLECQRYYFLVAKDPMDSFSEKPIVGVGPTSSSNSTTISVFLPIKMYGTPTMSTSGELFVAKMDNTQEISEIFQNKYPVSNITAAPINGQEVKLSVSIPSPGELVSGEYNALLLSVQSGSEAVNNGLFILDTGW